MLVDVPQPGRQWNSLKGRSHSAHRHRTATPKAVTHGSGRYRTVRCRAGPSGIVRNLRCRAVRCVNGPLGNSLLLRPTKWRCRRPLIGNKASVKRDAQSATAKRWITRIGLCCVLRPRQHSISYMGDGFYRSKDTTNSITGLKEMIQRTNQTAKKQNTHMHRCTDNNRDQKGYTQNKHNKSTSLH